MGAEFLVFHGYLNWLFSPKSSMLNFPLRVKWNLSIDSFVDEKCTIPTTELRTVTVKEVDVSWRGGIFFRGSDDANPDALWKVHKLQTAKYVF
jgi:hypothetical protein